MASLWCGSPQFCNNLCKYRAFTVVGITNFPSLHLGSGDIHGLIGGRSTPEGLCKKGAFDKRSCTAPRSSSSSNSDGSSNDPSAKNKIPFGYTRKDVLLIGVGVTVLGIGLKSGLEYAGVDPLQAGNVVQLVLVLGLTVGWISTYLFRVSNKEMTYAQQLRDYEKQVMEKRLESLTEAELVALLEKVDEEKRRVSSGEQINQS